ncbi:MAG: hypothetical protein IT438_14645 [Phycisphaerales bacterium]|nr:hypothetical protein [Phycisphaerales bacterium]
MPNVVIMVMNAIHEGSMHKLMTNPGPHMCPPPTPASPGTPMPLPVTVPNVSSFSNAPTNTKIHGKKPLTAKGPTGPSFSQNMGKQPGTIPPFDMVAAGVNFAPPQGKDRALVGCPNVLIEGGAAGMTGSAAEANTMT